MRDGDVSTGSDSCPWFGYPHIPGRCGQENNNQPIALFHPFAFFFKYGWMKNSVFGLVDEWLPHRQKMLNYLLTIYGDIGRGHPTIVSFLFLKIKATHKQNTQVLFCYLPRIRRTTSSLPSVFRWLCFFYRILFFSVCHWWTNSTSRNYRSLEGSVRRTTSLSSVLPLYVP